MSTTHEVLNQAPVRVGQNEYLTNLPLVEGIKRFDAEWATDKLTRIGETVGSAEFVEHANRANTNEPVLHTHDAYGNRIDEVEYDPSYHHIIGSAIADGAHTGAAANPRPGAAVARAATIMLYAQVEPGHACPVSMTHSALPVVEQNEELAKTWVPRLLSTEYNGKLAAGKPGAVFGMALTEKQGGSDVRANSTVAEPLSDGSYRLTGHKWFCSAPMSDAFLVTAHAPGGISCFLLPRVLEDGTRNEVRVMRLKDKMGNRSNASSEVEYEGAIAFRIGEEGRGIRTIIDMVARTRLDCILASAAGMRQATAEAAWHVRRREAFGKKLIDHPSMTAVIADLQLETEGAIAAALRVARSYDADADEQEQSFRRISTALTKYWVCKRGVAHAGEALECLGGNGVSEEFVLARRFREQPIMAVWEGSGNVIALDMLRALHREPESYEAFFAEVSRASGADARFDTALERTKNLTAEIARTAEPDARMRELTASMALLLQGALLLEGGPTEIADGFIASRLGEGARFAHLFGALPAGVDIARIAARA